MRNCWLAFTLCMITAACFFFSLGCGAERNATMVNSIGVNCDRIQDDLIWAFDLDEPSMMYDDTFPPYHNHGY